MLMDDEAFAGAVNEVLDLYQDLCEHHLANPDDRDGVTARCDAVFGAAMAHFLHDIDVITLDAVRLMFSRTVLTDERRIELAAKGIEPYHMPITREELMREAPGMIPLLLARAILCWRFHRMPMMPLQMRNWWPFVHHYACKIPNVC